MPIFGDLCDHDKSANTPINGASCTPYAIPLPLAPTLSSRITKGMVWNPNHGGTAFTVPMFDWFMKRIMPGQDWRTG